MREMSYCPESLLHANGSAQVSTASISAAKGRA